MKVGSVVYATQQGLGYLAKSFFDAGVVSEVTIVHHSSRLTFPSWFGNAPIVHPGDLLSTSVQAFIKRMDLMLFFETPFNWGLLELCRQLKVPTVMMPMYECMPRELPSFPDYFVNPSELDSQYFVGPYIPVPVPDSVQGRLRTKAKVFVHNAGNLGLLGRNGTEELLQAIPLVKSDAKFIIRCQSRRFEDLLNRYPKAQNDSRVVIEMGSVPYDKLWKDGDVFVFPEKFNGLSLPMQEAKASGLHVLCGDRFPMNLWCQQPLIPIDSYRKAEVSPRTISFREAVFHPQHISETIDRVYDMDLTQISQDNLEWAKGMRWAVLKERYMLTFEAMINSHTPNKEG